MASKGGLISEGIFTLVSLPTKGVKSLSWAENLFKCSVQERDLAPFAGNGTKVKTPSEIKLPFVKMELRFYLLSKLCSKSWKMLKNVAQCPLTIGIHKKKPPPTLGRQITTHFDACWGFCKNDFFLKHNGSWTSAWNFF